MTPQKITIIDLSLSLQKILIVRTLKYSLGEKYWITQNITVQISGFNWSYISLDNIL